MTDAAALVELALRTGGLSLVAVGGGNALIAALHEQTVDVLHALSEARFTESVALAQTAPGPNMLLIPLLGYETAGTAGALVALAAFVVPSTTLAVLGSRLIERHEGSRLVAALRWALRPVTGGLMLASAFVLVATAARSWPIATAATGPACAAGAAVVAVLALRCKINPLVWIGLAAALAAVL